MIPVTVAQVSLSTMGFVVLLRSAAGPRVLPIFIGAPEAQAIALRLDKVTVPRPLTHDLMKALLDNLECRLQRVVICALRESTFFAKLDLDSNAGPAEIDARPSDAIALALRCGAPIFVAEQVMDAAGVDMSAPPDGAPGAADPAETLKRQLEQAVSEERYEDAAVLRDRLKKLAPPN